MELSSSSSSQSSYSRVSSSSSSLSNLGRKPPGRNFKLPQIKDARSFKMLLTELEDQDFRRMEEDFNLRDSHVASFVGKFLKSSEFRQFQRYVDDYSRSERYFDVSILHNVSDTFEKTLSSFQLAHTIVHFHLKDSNFHIVPVENEENVAKVMGIILPEFIRFPISFYKKLEVRVLTFCSAINRVKTIDNLRFYKKILNWVFLTKEPINPITTKRHFYKTVWFNLKPFFPNFDQKWIKTLQRKSDAIALELIYGEAKNFYLEQDELDWPDILEDQFEIFCLFMENPRKNFSEQPGIHKKISLIRTTLKGYDYLL